MMSDGFRSSPKARQTSIQPFHQHQDPAHGSVAPNYNGYGTSSAFNTQNRYIPMTPNITSPFPSVDPAHVYPGFAEHCEVPDPNRNFMLSISHDIPQNLDPLVIRTQLLSPSANNPQYPYSTASPQALRDFAPTDPSYTLMPPYHPPFSGHNYTNAYAPPSHQFISTPLASHAPSAPQHTAFHVTPYNPSEQGGYSSHSVYSGSSSHSVPTSAPVPPLSYPAPHAVAHVAPLHVTPAAGPRVQARDIAATASLISPSSSTLASHGAINEANSGSGSGNGSARKAGVGQAAEVRGSVSVDLHSMGGDAQAVSLQRLPPPSQDAPPSPVYRARNSPSPVFRARNTPSSQPQHPSSRPSPLLTNLARPLPPSPSLSSLTLHTLARAPDAPYGTSPTLAAHTHAEHRLSPVLQPQLLSPHSSLATVDGDVPRYAPAHGHVYPHAHAHMHSHGHMHVPAPLKANGNDNGSGSDRGRVRGDGISDSERHSDRERGRGRGEGYSDREREHMRYSDSDRGYPGGRHSDVERDHTSRGGRRDGHRGDGLEMDHLDEVDDEHASSESLLPSLSLSPHASLASLAPHHTPISSHHSTLSSSSFSSSLLPGPVHSYAPSALPIPASRLYRPHHNSTRGACACCTSCLRRITSVSLSSLASSSLLMSSSVLATSASGFLTSSPNSRCARCTRLTKALWKQTQVVTTPVLSFFLNRKCLVFVLLVIAIVSLLILVVPSSVSLQSLVLPFAQVSEDLTWFPISRDIAAPVTHPVPLHPHLLLEHALPSTSAHNIYTHAAPATISPSLPRKKPFSQVITQVDVSSHPLPFPTLLSFLTHLATTSTTHVLISYAAQFPWAGPVAPLRAPTAYTELQVTALATHAQRLGLRLILDMPAIERWAYVLSLQRWSHLREDLSDSRYASLSHARVEALWREMVDQLIRAHVPDVVVYAQMLSAMESEGPLSTFGGVGGIVSGDQRSFAGAGVGTGMEGSTASVHDSGSGRIRSNGSGDISISASATTANTATATAAGADAGVSDGDVSTPTPVDHIDPALLDFGVPIGTALGKKLGISQFSQYYEQISGTSKSSSDASYHYTSDVPGASSSFTPTSSSAPADVVAGVYIGGQALSLSHCSSCAEGAEEDYLIAARYASACAHISSLPPPQRPSAQSEADYLPFSLSIHSLTTSISSMLTGAHYTCYLSDAHLRRMDERNMEVVAAANPYLIVTEAAADLNGSPPVLRHYIWSRYARHFPSRVLAGAMYRGAEREVSLVPHARARLANAAAWHVLALEGDAVGVALLGHARDENDVYMNEPLLATVPVMTMALHALTHKHFDADDRDTLFASYGLPFLPPPPASLTLQLVRPLLIAMWRDAATLMRLAPARVEYALLHPADAATAIAQTRTGIITSAFVTQSRQPSLTHSATHSAVRAGAATQSAGSADASGNSNGDGNGSGTDSTSRSFLSPLSALSLLQLTRPTPLAMLSQHSDALFRHALPTSSVPDPLLLHAPLPTGLAPVPVTGVWDAAGAMLMWGQAVHAIASEYGDDAHAWTPETAPHSVRIVTAFATTLLSTVYPLSSLSDLLLQHLGVDLPRIAAHTLTLVSQGVYGGAVADDVGPLLDEDMEAYVHPTAAVGGAGTAGRAASTAAPHTPTVASSSSNVVPSSPTPANPIPAAVSTDTKIETGSNTGTGAGVAGSPYALTTAPTATPTTTATHIASGQPSEDRNVLFSTGNGLVSVSSGHVKGISGESSAPMPLPPSSSSSPLFPSSSPPANTPSGNTPFVAASSTGTGVVAGATSTHTPTDTTTTAATPTTTATSIVRAAGAMPAADSAAAMTTSVDSATSAAAAPSAGDRDGPMGSHSNGGRVGDVGAVATVLDSFGDSRGTHGDVANDATMTPTPPPYSTSPPVPSPPTIYPLPPLTSSLSSLTSENLLQALPVPDTRRVNVISRSKTPLYYTIATIATMIAFGVFLWRRRAKKQEKDEYSRARSWDLDPIADMDELDHV